jgi:competence/damage-inducible protein CinA-like protein
VRATIISVGSEILRGTLLDTNAQYFAQELHSLGAQVIRITQVPDDLPDIVSALRASCDASDIVIMSGGLGPTEDDLSREAIIRLTGESPTVNENIVRGIRERFELRGDIMPARNEKQAWEIPSADVIPNDHGTAPGWMVKFAESVIITLPGPPRENRPMWRDIVRARLLPYLVDQAIVSRTIKTIGIGESAVADRLGQLIASEWPDIATYAKGDGVHVTVTASHPDRSAADEAVRSAVDEILGLIGDHVYGFGDESLAAAITQPLAAASAQMAVWEAGTAGVFATLLLSDSQAQGTVSESRTWSKLPTDLGNARDFAREATNTSGVGIAAALIARYDSLEGRVTDGSVHVALAHAGRIVDRIQNVRGTPDEIRRRSALLAAEFLWIEIRSAAGVQTASDVSNRSSST